MSRMPIKIIGAPLTKPPGGADKLSSKGSLLTVWRRNYFVTGEDGARYHFAIYSPARGWRGYRWDEKYGVPIQILPGTQDAVWAHTNENHLMRLQIAQNGEATITAKARCNSLFDADESGCLVRNPKRTIQHLHFNKDQRRLSRTKIYKGAHPNLAYFLPDGATVINDDRRLIVLSPEGWKICKEAVVSCNYSPPFITNSNKNNFRYTADPRGGWAENDILEVHQKRIGGDSPVLFLAMIGNKHYIALVGSWSRVCLYSFSSQSPAQTEPVLEIANPVWDVGFASYNELICITSPSPILGSGATPIPENDGFLAWDPLSNTFYTDIPRTPAIQKVSAGREPTTSIPDIWGQDIRHTPKEITCASLTEPPRGIAQLSSKGNLLVAWQWWDSVADNNRLEYHFVLHSPAWGWRGYRWDEEYGLPLQILPVPSGGMWACAPVFNLIHLQIGQNGEVTVTDTGVEILSLLDADERGCLVQKGSGIEYLHFSEDKRKIYKRALYGDERLNWAYFLPDNAIAISDYGRLIVLSPEGGKKLHEEKVYRCYNFSPFIVCQDDGGCIYYTDDPRKGWHKSYVTQAHRELAGNSLLIKFFTILGDICYIALGDSHNDTVWLYRFSSNSPEHVEHMWKLDRVGFKAGFALYNRLICVASPQRIVSDDTMHIPENDGFLVWDPITNTFHTDIPRATNIQKILPWRVPTVSIPHPWGKSAQR